MAGVGAAVGCTGCHRQISVTAATIFQDSRLPLTVWFRPVWWVTSQKNELGAMGLQRVLGLKSYKTAYADVTETGVTENRTIELIQS